MYWEKTQVSFATLIYQLCEYYPFTSLSAFWHVMESYGVQGIAAITILAILYFEGMYVYASEHIPLTG